MSACRLSACQHVSIDTAAFTRHETRERASQALREKRERERERERERSESESRRERQRLGSAAVQQRDATCESSRDMPHARAKRCESKEMRERGARASHASHPTIHSCKREKVTSVRYSSDTLTNLSISRLLKHPHYLTLVERPALST
jgi:hypothetical protein